ncbi:hypothetical protein [uncultured Methanobrevibacter sp.]|uniref:hypothetical protein n=1 Tax=uncultured Methanobrevibacter sp. TaxID=253161 RepID=UPI0025D0CCF6|nr:hypothetical protein [uncultured Methanobrevibacter sp.]
MVRTLSQMSNSELLEIVQMKMANGGLTMDEIDACLWFETKLLDGEKLTDSEIDELGNM